MIEIISSFTVENVRIKTMGIPQNEGKTKIFTDHKSQRKFSTFKKCTHCHKKGHLQKDCFLLNKPDTKSDKSTEEDNTKEDL